MKWGITYILPLLACCWCGAAWGQLQILPDKDLPGVFAGNARKISVVFRNSGSETVETQLSTQLYQATSATAARRKNTNPRPKASPTAAPNRRRWAVAADWKTWVLPVHELISFHRVEGRSVALIRKPDGLVIFEQDLSHRELSRILREFYGIEQGAIDALRI